MTNASIYWAPWLCNAADSCAGSLAYENEDNGVQGDGPLRLLQSVACMSFNGRYNRLYTVTAQCLEANAGAVQDLLARSVASFRPPPSLAY